MGKVAMLRWSYVVQENPEKVAMLRLLLWKKALLVLAAEKKKINSVCGPAKQQK